MWNRLRISGVSVPLGKRATNKPYSSFCHVSVTVHLLALVTVVIIIFAISPRGMTPSPPSNSSFSCHLCVSPMMSWIRDVLSLLIVVRHVSLDRLLGCLPSGAHVGSILGFCSEDVLRPWPSHFHLLALTC